MAQKQYFAIIDTETTITDKVADFGIVICDRQGEIFAQCGVLVQGVFGVDSLFYTPDADPLWSRASVTRRTDNYTNMLNNGTRMVASVMAVNRWIDKAIAKYNPTLTAYNLAFDENKCRNTDIELTGFKDKFCLWAASVGNICNTKSYRQFVLENHLFNTPTKHANMTFRTDAEAVTGYLSGIMTQEPHTSVEDIIGYELPTLKHILKKRGWKEKIESYNWRAHQVKQHFKAN